MNSKFLKSTTAIVLSLSLVVPHAAMAQTAAELEAELGVNTDGLTEAEMDELRQQLADQRAAAEATTEETAETAEQAVEETAESAEETAEQTADTVEETAEQAAEESESLLDRAVGAATEQLNELTGNDDTEASAEATTEAPAAEAEVDADATADAATDAPAAEEPATEEMTETADAPEATTDAETEATAEAEATTTGDEDAAVTADTETTTDADAETTEMTAETEAETDAAADTTDMTAETEATDEEPTALEETVDNLQAEVDRLTGADEAEMTAEATEETATAQAEAEAAQAEEQATSMAAQSDSTDGAEVVESTVTEDNARSSSEEFETQVTATDGNAQATTNTQTTASNDDDGLDTIGKIALFGLGALAVGELLKNGSEVVSNSGDRVVVQQPDGSYRVLKNDDVLMFQPGTDVKTYAYDDGSTRTVAVRADGTQIETIRAADGTVLRRTRILEDGSQVVLFDDTRVAEAVEVNQLPQVTETRNTVNFEQAEEDDLRRALQAQMPEGVDRRFSLSQVRNINNVRNLVPEIDVDNINFETGSSVIRPQEAEELAQLGTLMRESIQENPGQVFLIEGHTDAVGSAGYNLALSDRRAESVALALTEYFDVPPENMVVQGYGEYDLKVRTAEAERMNRRAAVRNITALLSGS